MVSSPIISQAPRAERVEGLTTLSPQTWECKAKRLFASEHEYAINALSLSSDGEYFLSARPEWRRLASGIVRAFRVQRESLEVNIVFQILSSYEFFCVWAVDCVWYSTPQQEALVVRSSQGILITHSFVDLIFTNVKVSVNFKNIVLIFTFFANAKKWIFAHRRTFYHFFWQIFFDHSQRTRMFWFATERRSHCPPVAHLSYNVCPCLFLLWHLFRHTLSSENFMHATFLLIMNCEIQNMPITLHPIVGYSDFFVWFLDHSPHSPVFNTAK